ncbi:aminotransferase class V-fold PLP-dependent enzyme [Candidatus Margulisiibacteriota bacterium]
MKNKYIYFDNAATSYPKPPQVISAMQNFMRNIGANPGRSGHSLSVDAGRVLFETRELISSFFNVGNSDNVVFTLNATHALNIALKGILKSGDHVITSSWEHNAVMRPLNWLAKHKSINFTQIKNKDVQGFDKASFQTSIRPETRLVVLTHASNVTGQILPIKEIGKICMEKRIVFLVDCAQTAGVLPIDMQKDKIDLLTFTGHKGLFGPQGTGGLCINNRTDIESLAQGGTGSRSEHEEQPEFLPDKLEAGTPNTPGITGLRAGIEFILKTGFDTIYNHKQKLSKTMLDGLRNFKEIEIYNSDKCCPGIISFNIRDRSPAEIAHILDKEYGILTRPGLQCAPSAHKTINTFPEGTLRISLSYFNNKEEIDCLIGVLEKIIRK